MKQSGKWELKMEPPNSRKSGQPKDQIENLEATAI